MSSAIGATTAIVTIAELATHVGERVRLGAVVEGTEPGRLYVRDETGTTSVRLRGGGTDDPGDPVRLAPGERVGLEGRVAGHAGSAPELVVTASGIVRAARLVAPVPSAGPVGVGPAGAPTGGMPASGGAVPDTGGAPYDRSPTDAGTGSTDAPSGMPLPLGIALLGVAAAVAVAVGVTAANGRRRRGRGPGPGDRPQAGPA